MAPAGQLVTLEVGLLDDAAWNAARRRLFILTHDAAARSAVQAIDPDSASIERMAEFDQPAERIALSEDGSRLWVVFGSSGRLRCFRAEDFAVEAEIPLPEDPWSSGYAKVSAIAALPRSCSVLVAWQAAGAGHVTAFDGAVARPAQITDRRIDSLYRRPSDGQWLAAGGGLVYWLDVDAAGVRIRWNTGERAFPHSVPPHSWSPTAVVDSFGYLYDLRSGAPAGRIAMAGGRSRRATLVSEPGDAIYALYSTGSANSRVVRYSRRRLVAEAELELPVSGEGRLLRWGEHGIGIWIEGKLMLAADSAFRKLAEDPLPSPTAEPGGAIRIPLATGGIVFDERRQVLYASVPGHAGTFGNSVVTIDAATGAAGDPLPVGSEPGSLALDAGAGTLLVALTGAPQVARIDLETRALQAPYNLFDPGVPGDRAVFWRPRQLLGGLPEPDAVVVLRDDEGAARDIAVFDRRGPRPDSIRAHYFADVLAPAGVPGAVYSLNTSTTSFDLRLLAVDSRGVRLDRTLRPVAGSFRGTLAAEAGRIFTGNGEVWSADTETLFGSIASAGFPLPDAATNRVFYVPRGGAGSDIWVFGFDLATFRPVRWTVIRNSASAPLAAIWAGSDRIAIRTESEVILLPLQTLERWPDPEVVAETLPSGIRRLRLPVTALAAAPGGRTLLAATSSVFGEWGNAVVEIDPLSGGVRRAAFAGSEPTMLAVSGDGRSVYAYLAGEMRIGRVNLDAGERDLVFAADPSGGGRQYYIWDMAAQPGTGALAVSYPGGSIALFEDGQPRPVFDRNEEHFSRFAARYGLAFHPRGEMLYGYNQWTTDFDIKRCRVSPDGVRALSAAGGLAAGFRLRIQAAGGLLYSAAGDVIDPERSRRAGRFADPLLEDPTRSRQVLVAPHLGSAFFVSGHTLLQFDLETRALTGRLAIAELGGEVASLLAWGEGGLAFHTTGGEIYLLDVASIPRVTAPAPRAEPQPPSSPGVRVLDLAAEDLAVDAVRGLLYASVPNREGALGDSIAVIDPATLQILDVWSAGANPRHLALGGDGRSLYFTMGKINNGIVRANEKLRRLDLETGALSPPYAEDPLPSEAYVSLIADLAPLPGLAESIAVVHEALGAGRVRIYDGLRERAAAVTSPYACTSIQAGASPDRLYCYNGRTTDFAFSRLEVGPDGVSVLARSGPELIGEHNISILFDRGLIYTSNGRVIDPEAMREVGRVPARGPVAVDGERVFWLEPVLAAAGQPVERVVLKAFDRASLRPVSAREIRLWEGSSGVTRLVACGAGRLAFPSGRQIYVIDPLPEP